LKEKNILKYSAEIRGVAAHSLGIAAISFIRTSKELLRVSNPWHAVTKHFDSPV